MKLRILVFKSLTILLLSSSPVLAGTLDCTGCHAQSGSGDLRPLDSSYRNITTGAFQGNHQNHMASVTKPETCAVCHNNANYQSDHRDNYIQIASKIDNYSGTLGRARYMTKRPVSISNGSIFFNQTSVPVLAGCSNITCHFEVITPIWGTTASMNCSSCHGNPPTGQAPEYSGGISGSHQAHSLNPCSKCHPDHSGEFKPFAHATSIGRRNLSVIPRNSDGSPGSYTSMDRNYLPGQTASHQFGSCNTLYCHSNGNPSGGSLVFAATPAWGQTTTCNSCHGAVPSTNNHTAHLNSIPSLTCEACHSGKGSGTTSHANGVKDVVISTLFDDGVTNPVTTATTAGCSNVSCHGKLTSPSWSAASAFDVYAADSSNCQMCHLLIGSTPAEKVAQSSYIEVYSGDNLSGADGSYYGYGAIFNLHMAHINEAAGLTQNGVIYCSDCHSSSRLQQQNFHFSQLVGGGKSLAKFAKGPAASTVGDAVGATDTMISSYSYGSSAPRGTCTPKPGFGCHTLGAVTRYWYK